MARSFKLVLGSLALALVLAGLSAADTHGLRRMRRLRSDIGQIEEKNRVLEADNARLAREIRALQGDPRALERAAREELGFIKQGEVVFAL